MTHSNRTSMRETVRGTFLMRQPKKLLRALAVASALLIAATSCKLQDFLDVNTNPNGPTTVAPNVYLPPMLYWMSVANPYEGRYTGRYTQMQMLCCSSPPGTWDRMGYDPTSDNGGIHWYVTYWQLGLNLIHMIDGAEAAQRWDLAGVGYLMKAWGFMSATDTYGELPVKQAWDTTRYYFDYDTQDYAYSEVLRLIDKSITNLKRTDGIIEPTFWGQQDKVYGGDRTKWLKAAYALKAIALNHFSNKSTYSPAAVMANVDSSFASSADDWLFPYPNLNPGTDGSFQGPRRGNFPSYRQTTFVLNLMNGTALGSTVDPRMSRMLSPSPDGLFRGYDINATASITPTAAAPQNFWGYASTPALGLPTRYIFDDKTKYPLMTYAEMQFIKAEAAYRMGDKASALAAYKNGIGAHIDFVNARNLDNSQTPTQISATEKTAFLADPKIVPASASSLTLSQIMVQKYIALWEWGFDEVWMDLRRFHYTDIDPATGTQVYPGFAIPTNLYPDNGSKPVYRIRPRYNSEYVWNIASLTAIGAMAADYHTKPTWIVNP